MLAVQVELLTGRYAATQFNDRSKAEWPPHPARLFSAAVAMWAEADPPDDAEREALTWWEAQGSPAITCSWRDEWGERTAVTHYVPVNDAQVVGRDLSSSYSRLREALDAVTAARSELAAGTMTAKTVATLEKQAAAAWTKAAADSMKAASNGTAPRSALAVMPDSRGRQARVYPTVIPSESRITYVWETDDAVDRHTVNLDHIFERIARLGHSSSCVSITVVDHAPAATLVPDLRGLTALRVATPGQMEALELAYATHHGTEPRTLPAEIVTYTEAREASTTIPRSHFGKDWVLLDLEGGTRFTLRDSLALARTVRSALMSHSEEQPPPEVISGHAASIEAGPTPPSVHPHLAVVPLPFVGHPHADGIVQAVGLLVPTVVSDEARAQVLAAVSRWCAGGTGPLRLGAHSYATVRPMPVDDAPRSARPDRWCSPSRRWVTVTPIALDRHPGDLSDHNVARRERAVLKAEEAVARACINIGLPHPTTVSVTASALTRGSRPARSFPPYAVKNGRLRRMLVHAEIVFAEQVNGPVLLGAGRYLGYGLCSPDDPPAQYGRSYGG